MSKKSFGREFAEEVFLKAVHSAVPIAAGIVLSPVGIAAVAIVATAAVACSGSDGGGSTGDASQSKETG